MKTGLAVSLDPSKKSNKAQFFENSLRKKIIGQESAVTTLVETYQMFLAGLNPPGRPVGNLLFLGPTGSGKTRAVEAMAETFFGDSRAVIKIDCGEFQHSHEIAKLVGSPPGYLGHTETSPLLTQERINQWQTEEYPITIMLFDEIEKASDSLWKLLLGILDKAIVTLGTNARVDFSRCVIVMTSNLGVAELSNISEGFGFIKGKQLDKSKTDKVCLEAARRKFDPEFMNRIDKVIMFNHLDHTHLENILDIELGKLQERVLLAPGNIQFVFTLSKKVKDFLLMEGFSKEYGARHLKRAIEKSLVLPLSSLVSSGQIRLGDFVSIDMNEDKFIFIKEAEGALVPVLLEKYARQLEKRPPERGQYTR